MIRAYSIEQNIRKTPSNATTKTMFNKTQKLTLGIVLLLIVDVIWVASSELTKVSNNLSTKKTVWVVNTLNLFLVLVSR